MIRVVFVDDHAVMRLGVKILLENTGSICVVADFGSGVSALAWLATNACDVVIVDIMMSPMGGATLLQQIKLNHPKLPVLIFSAYPEDMYGVRMIKLGASGYLTKEASPREIVDAVIRVAGGRKHLSPDLAEMLAHEIHAGRQPTLHESLSGREYEIMLYISNGKSSADIATKLNLSIKTVGTYRARLLEKTGLKNTAGITQYVHSNHLTPYDLLSRNQTCLTKVGSVQPDLFQSDGTVAQPPSDPAERPDHIEHEESPK